MTPEERAEWQVVIGHMPRRHFDLLLKVIEENRQKAISAEREACAKVAEDYGDMTEIGRSIARRSHSREWELIKLADRIAAAIRARS